MIGSTAPRRGDGWVVVSGARRFARGGGGQGVGDGAPDRDRFGGEVAGEQAAAVAALGQVRLGAVAGQRRWGGCRRGLGG